MTLTRPRMLEVFHSYGVGGSQVVAVELAKQLRDDGVDVLCAALDASPGPILSRCHDYGLPVIELGVPWRNPLGRNGISWRLARRLKELRLDAIHVQHFLGLHKLGLPARLAGVNRIVATEHSVFDVNQSLAGRFRARLNWRLATAITVVHPGIKEYLCSKLRMPSERVTVIPVGIDVSQYRCEDRSKARRKLGITSELVFVFVGRLAPVKNVPQLVESFLAVQAAGSPIARLVVVGDGQDMGAIREAVGKHPLGARVLLAGESADVRPYLAAGDIFVLNSLSEGAPRALLEAMAMGLPAIGPAVGDIPQMIEGRGWLTQPGDRSTLEQAMRCVLVEPHAVAAAARNCQSFVMENYDARAVAMRYRRLLTKEDPRNYAGQKSA